MYWANSIFTSRISGRDYRIENQSRLCVCVCNLALSRLNCLMYRKKYLSCRSTWTISRSTSIVKSKVKVTRWESVIFMQFHWSFSDLNGMIKSMAYDVMSWCHVTSQHDVTKWRQMSKRTLKCPTHRCVNAGAFSLSLFPPTRKKNLCQDSSSIEYIVECRPHPVLNY